jgi:hypothetical protein
MALQEAWEEVGVLGIVLGQPLSSHRFTKAGIRRSRHWLLPYDSVTRAQFFRP